MLAGDHVDLVLRAGSLTEGTFFPPVTFSPWWGVLAATLVALVIAFYIVVPLLTRAPRRAHDDAAVPEFVMPDVPLSEKYGDLIAEVEADHRAGRVSSRAAHQRLSLLVRYFAFESTGMRAPTMTLADLRDAQSPELSDAVERLYPGAFAAIEGGSVAEAAEHARRVVKPWN
ncbi:hypothetical protein [Marisediminicola sp. LYQ134]|uniref:hypothetical protein n=1 Tax=Marisediminicola sp. LYQ134 TaxID=3391061 RepID=UPI0039830366